MKVFFLTLIFLAFVPHTFADKPLVLTSIPPLSTLIKNIGGEKVQVEGMIPAGAKAETFEPNLHQLEESSKAQLFISVGHPQFPFETLWMSRLKALNPGLKIVKATDAIPLLEDDPHVWLSPKAFLKMAKNVSAALSLLLPGDVHYFETNLISFQAKVGALDAKLTDKFKLYQGKVFLVFHPAWGYFANDYGLIQMSIEEHGKEPGPAKLADLIAEANKQHIKVVFVEPQFPQQGPELIAKELNARIEEINDLAEDWFSNLEHVSDLLVESFQ